MRSTQRFSVLLLVLGVFSSSSSGQQGEPSDDDILSPSLQSLRTALSAGSQSALGEFWANVESRGTPLLEQVPNDSLHLFVTFLWRSKESFYLDVGRFPGELLELTAGGYLHPPDLLDPWGQRYGYRISAGGFRVAGYDSDGRPDDELFVSHRFTGVQRMMMAPDPPASP